MPDLLSHAFIAFTLCSVLRLRFNWVTSQYVTVGMAGAFIPDMAKIDLLLDGDAIAAAIGLPFSWFGIHTLGGALVATLIGVVVVATDERRRVFALLTIGASSHLIADALLLKASGRSYALLWPLTQNHPPTPGLYLSTDLWPSLLTGGAALVAWLVVRQATAET